MIDYCRDQIAAFARRQRASLTEFEVELQDGVRLGQRLIPGGNRGRVRARWAVSPGGLRAHEHHDRQGGRRRPRHRLLAAEPGERGQSRRRDLSGDALRDDRGRRRRRLSASAAYRRWGHGLRDREHSGGGHGGGPRESVRRRGQAADLRDRRHRSARGADGDPRDRGRPRRSRRGRADLLGQAEHGPTSPAILVTTSRALGQAVLRECERQLPLLGTQEVARRAWEDNGEVILVDERRGGRAGRRRVRARASRGADEATTTGFWAASGTTARSSWARKSTVAYSDKTIGPNHILPTGRAARYTGGLCVGKFIKTVTYQRLTRDGERARGAHRRAHLRDRGHAGPQGDGRPARDALRKG